MAKRRTTVLLNLALLGVSLGIALLLSEAALRIFPALLPEAAQLRVHWNELIAQGTVSQAHPTIGFLYPKNYAGEVRRRDFHFTYTTDEKGFRNQDPWPDTADIVALGDSQTFGYGVSDDESFPSLLAEALPHSRVLNLGLIGASPQQYQRVYDSFGSSVHPKIVLFGLFPGNDVSDARTFQAWLDAGGEGNYDIWRFFGGRPPGSGRGWREHLESSYLMTFLRETKRSFGSQFAGRTFETADGSRLRLAPSIRRSNAERARPGHPDFELVMEAIEATRARAEADGAAFLVLLIPTKEEVYLPMLGRSVPDAAGPFARQLEADGIPTLDLTPAFKERANAGEALFFEVDGHANARGYALIAKVLLDHFQANEQRYALPDGA